MAEPRNKFLVSSFGFQVTNCEARNMEIFAKPNAGSWRRELASLSRLKLETRNSKLSLPHHGGVFRLDFVEDSYFTGLAVGIFVDA